MKKRSSDASIDTLRPADVMAAANPLDVYRKKATFDVDALRILLDGQEAVETMYQVWDTLAKDPLFVLRQEELTLDQQRELAFKRVKRLVEYGFSFDTPRKILGYMHASTMHDFPLQMLYGLHMGVGTAKEHTVG